MAVATLRHSSTFMNNNASSSANSTNISSRSGAGDIIHTQLQQGGHSISTPTHGQTSGIWELANSTDMSYELAAAGTGKLIRSLSYYFLNEVVLKNV